MGRSKKSANKILPESPKERKKNPVNSKFLSPQDEYVYSLENITLKELADKWSVIRGNSYQTLLDRSTKENWVQKREKYRIEICKKENAIIEENELKSKQKLIDEARLRHHKLGDLFIGVSGAAFNDRIKQTKVCPHCNKDITVSFLEKMTPQSAIRAGQVGVDIQRKGLGLDDLHFHVSETKQVVFNVMEVISKHVTEPDLYQSIRRGLIEIVRKEQEILDVTMSESKTVDVLQRNTKNRG